MTEIQNEHNEPEQGTDSGGAIEVGRRLKEAREKAGTDINELAVRLRLTSSQLEAIERGDLDQFGAAIYVRGYVANYARLVGLKPKPLLEQLSLDEDKPPLTTATGTLPGQRLAENLARVATYAVGTVVLALPLLWWASEGSLDALFGGANAPQGESVAAVEAEADGKADEGAGDEAERGTGSGKESDPGDQPVMASMAMPRGSRQPEAAKAPGDEADAADASDGTALEEPVAETPVELVLEVSEDSWVEIRDDAGERLEYDLLRAGTTHRYQGSAPYSVLIGNAGAVTVRYNDAPFDMAPFVQGNLARFEIGAGSGEG